MAQVYGLQSIAESASSPSLQVTGALPPGASRFWCPSQDSARCTGWQVGDCYMEAGSGITLWESGYWRWDAMVSSGDTNDTWHGFVIEAYDATGKSIWRLPLRDFHMTQKDVKYSWRDGPPAGPDPALISAFPRIASYNGILFSCRC